jgi:sugar lactone lactonase YvrE
MAGIPVSLPGAAQSSEYLVIDNPTAAVLRFDAPTGVFLNVLISSGSGGLTNAQDITVGPDNNLYVTDFANGSVKRYNSSTGAYMGDFVGSGSGGLSNPDQPVFGPDGNLYVSDRFSGSVLRYNGRTGASLGVFVSDGRLGGFVAFTFGPDGRLYASMFNGSPQCILRFNGTTGAFVDVFACAPDSSSAFSGLAFGADGRLYASRYHLGEVWQLDSSGKLLGTLHCPGDTRADYLGFGPDGVLYVSNLSPSNASRFDVQTGQCLGSYPIAGKITSGKGFVWFSPTTPSLTTPAPGSSLSGSTATFAWSNPGNLVPRFVLRLGTTGFGTVDVLSGAANTGTSQQVSAIPTDGAYLYARLWYYLNGNWQFSDAKYTESGTPTPPALTTPAPGSTLPGSTVTFGWDPGVGPTRFVLRLGTTGPGSSNVSSGASTTGTSVQVAPLPTTGAKLYARLWYYLNEKWQYVDAIYTEASK